ncbi:MAG: GNAT family N-acetyltransferase [Candidatus Cloacimonetes bacterium]|nr:GNAT family N-acetyltransferase [Candidatus Cloacimonadota bacterium]MCF7813175.1 GNAT family N-acetyltransferase [Candidatus Cloacimonadota bacterium]MCF7867623.1 GNAT family N-acetyltransferase [Candidatus Cloacimonadota bacterium]MCF7883102.1 GNAT family N-acetyltransferase [Candidatus Cloacimonadota bacterium]
MIKYTSEINNLKPEMLTGFFVGWPNSPSPKKHYEILQYSYKFLAAVEDGKVLGFINAISDGVQAAYIPLLEVLPEYQGKGIGRKLVELMLEELKEFYMIDLVCDEKMTGFYNKFGLQKFTAMGVRNMEKQNGECSELRQTASHRDLRG